MWEIWTAFCLKDSFLKLTKFLIKVFKLIFYGDMMFMHSHGVYYYWVDTYVPGGVTKSG